MRRYSNLMSSLPLIMFVIHQVTGNWMMAAAGAAAASSNFGISASKLFPLQSKHKNPVCYEEDNDNVTSTTSPLSSSDKAAELDVEQYLSPKYNGQKFYVQGWRWHTLSLIRDSHRLKKYAEQICSSKDAKDANLNHEKVQSLNIAARHVVDFNLRGLQRIEDETFFPWLRKKLVEDASSTSKYHKVEQGTKDAFSHIIDAVDRDRKKVGELASMIRSEVQTLEDLLVLDSDDRDMDIVNHHVDGVIKNATYKISQLSQDISTITMSILDREDRLLVPAVAVLVPSGEQKSFNNRVLRNLGIFESRCHLVAMHDAVHDSHFGNARERALFHEQIPSVARMMIGRWKKSLYNPKVGVLEEVDTKN